MDYILTKSILISLAIVGLRIVSSKGMILHFLRMPYEWVLKELDLIENNDDYSNDSDSLGTLIGKLSYGLMLLIMKLPLKAIIGCVTCMSGLYTVLIDYAYFKLSWHTLLTVFIVACLNSIIFALYELISAMIKHYTNDTCK